MSMGKACACKDRDQNRERRWRVTQRQCNHSKFNGGHHTPSAWSEVVCLVCLARWRTKAGYVYDLKDDEGEYRSAVDALSTPAR